MKSQRLARILLLIVVGIVTTSCSDLFRTGANLNLNIEWQFYNRIDSTRLNINFQRTIAYNTSYEYTSFLDTITSQGTFFHYVNIHGIWEDEFLATNPTLHARFEFDSVTVLDTILTWSDLDFKPGDNFWNQASLYVSKKTFYITLP